MKRLALTPATLIATLAGTAHGQSAEPFPAEFELSSLQPANGGEGEYGFVIRGINTWDSSGYSVSAAGDVNGDGLGDVIIGAWRAAARGNYRAGQSYIVFGDREVGEGGVVELRLLDGANGFVINGINADDGSGFSVAAAGDVNGDGLSDVIIGARDAAASGARYRAGQSYVVFGRDTSVSGEFPFIFQLWSLSPFGGGDGTNGFVLDGVDKYDFSGAAVSSAGDVNGDGVDDVVVGAPWANPPGRNGAGESYVVFGRDPSRTAGFTGVFQLGSLIPFNGGDGTDGFVIYGPDSGADFGNSVSPAGDVNGDGIDDLLIGAHHASPRRRINAGAGQTYVIFGGAGLGSGGLLDLLSLDGTNGFVINGVDMFDNSGVSVSSAGDVNGDGIDDIIIGARDADPHGESNAGESYVVFGGAGVGSGGVLNLSSLDGTNGFVIHGVDASDISGFSVSSAGDVNGDGFADLLIGAQLADPDGKSAGGESYVVFGGADSVAGGVIELSSLDGINGFMLKGIDVGDLSGVSVSSAGDMNGDGVDDILIGAVGGDPNYRSYAGESYVVFGRNLVDKEPCPGDSNNDSIVNFDDIVSTLANWQAASGSASTGSGDADGNGVVDFDDMLTVLANWQRSCP